MSVQRVWLIAAIVLAISGQAAEVPAQCAGTCAGSVSPPDVVMVICPKGDTPTLGELGAQISLPFLAPVPEGSVYPSEQCGTLAFCVPPVIDGPLDAGGTATFTGGVIGGGSTDRWLWWCGWIPEPLCISVEVEVRMVSPDINGDLIVNLQDLALFGAAWPPQPYDARADFNGDMMIGLVDLARFAEHFQHGCE